MNPSDNVRQDERQLINTKNEIIAVLAAFTAPVLLILVFASYYHFIN